MPVWSAPHTAAIQGKRVFVPIRVFIPKRIGRRHLDGRRASLQSPGVLHQLFIAANSAGIQIAVYPQGLRTGIVTSLVGNITATSSHCTATTGGRTCSFSLGVPPGRSYDFVVATFDAAPSAGVIPGSAKQLGAAVATAKIATGKANVLHVTVGGVVAKVTLSVAEPSAFHSIAPGTEALTVGALDADGNLILSDGYVDANGNPVTIALNADANAGSTISFTPSKVSDPSRGVVVLSYSALAATPTQLNVGFTTTVTAKASSGSSASIGQIVQTPDELSNATDSGPEDIAFYNGGLVIGAYSAPAMDYATLGVSSSFPLSANYNPVGIAFDSDGSGWFALPNSDRVGLMTIRSALYVSPRYVVFPANSGPIRLANGPDHAMWVSEINANAIGRFGVNNGDTGALTHFPLPTSAASPEGITAGPDGAMWFAECAVGKIGRIPVTATPGSSAQIREFAIPASGLTLPLSIVAGNDGALWFTDQANPVIWRMTVSGAVTSFAIPSGNSATEIARGPDGALWFTEQDGDAIGRIVPAQAKPASSGIVEFNAAVSGGSPYGITVGPDGAVYYTERSKNQWVRFF